MNLHERLRTGVQGTPEPSAQGGAVPDFYHEILRRMHRVIVEKLDLAQLERLAPDAVTAELRRVIGRVMETEDIALNRVERERLVQDLLDELTGLGPLQPLLQDPGISDILVNGYDTVYIERDGKLSPVPVRFRDNDHLLQIIGRIVSRVGRRVDEHTPMVDARLPDGSRVNAIIPPLALDGPVLSIRRFGVRPIRAEDLVSLNSATQDMMDFLSAAVRARLNILVSGGTGTGKTTFLNALSSFIPAGERIVTIEDAAELQLQQPHVVRLETRPPNVEGLGDITQRDLMRNSLRMRPDRIVVGEVRGAEVLDMLQAMNTGHEGSMTTVHANSPRDALNRLSAMLGMAGLTLSEGVSSQTLSRAIDLIVHLNRGSDGHRRLVSVSEITGTEGTVITMQEIFRFDQRGVDSEGRVLGEFQATGIFPRCADRIRRAGYALKTRLQ